LKQEAQSLKASSSSSKKYVNSLPTQPSSIRNAPAAVPSATDLPPLPKDPKLGKYFEYDLSRLHNSKGGFLVAETEDENTAGAIRREKARERARIAAGEEPG
jgi:DNA-repair protein complementing XP-A cells